MSSDNSLIKESKDVLMSDSDYDCVADENYAQTNYKSKIHKSEL